MKNIKKYVGILALAFMITSCNSATVLSSDRTFYEAHLGKSKIEDKLSGRFDFDKDIAVASKASRSELAARTSAEAKMHSAIENYSYSILKQLLSDSAVKGPGFDNYQMKKYATEIADRYTRTSREIGKFKDEDKNEYYIALKMDKKTLKDQAIKIFTERVNRVIERLKELKEGV